MSFSEKPGNYYSGYSRATQVPQVSSESNAVERWSMFLRDDLRSEAKACDVIIRNFIGNDRNRYALAAQIGLDQVMPYVNECR